MITIQIFKCTILKPGLLRIDPSHWYLYALLILSFDEICNSEQYRVIVGYSPTPGQQVSAISCEYHYYGWIYITNFSCYSLFGFHAIYFYSTKIRNNIF